MFKLYIFGYVMSWQVFLHKTKFPGRGPFPGGGDIPSILTKLHCFAYKSSTNAPIIHRSERDREGERGREKETEREKERGEEREREKERVKERERGVVLGRRAWGR